MASVSAFSGQDVLLTLTPYFGGDRQETEPVRGFSGASDAIKFEESQEIVNAREGMDGFIFFSRSGRLGGIMTIKMLPNSPSLKVLMTNAYKQKSGSADVQWEGNIELTASSISAQLKRGMMTHIPVFPTLGMSNVDDLQFSFYFTQIIANYDNANFEVFDADL